MSDDCLHPSFVGGQALGKSIQGDVIERNVMPHLCTLHMDIDDECTTWIYRGDSTIPSIAKYCIIGWKKYEHFINIDVHCSRRDGSLNHRSMVLKSGSLPRQIRLQIP